MADQKDPAKESNAAAATATATASAQPPAQQHVEDIPDPDEDDLDDLDDVLDEFSATKLDDKAPLAPTNPATATTTTTAATTKPPPPIPVPSAGEGDEEIDEEEFARQLQAGMAELLGGLGDSPEMTQQLESLVKELGAAGAGGTGTGTSSSSGTSSKAAAASPGGAAGGAGAGSSKAGEDKFQEQIRRTMERMQASGEQATAAASSSGNGNPDDILAQMLAEMEKGGGMGGGEFGSDEDFSKMLMGMMEQLTNKEILYEPMKELYDKFPDWLAKNREKTDKADLERYEEQHRCVKDIVERFERPGYTDDSAADREFIVDRMQKMQAAGSPPQDLVGDMSSAQEAMGELDQGCATQ
ncbi:pex19 family protein [Diplodia corticola]|uniref:Pex19 family protein n=1 Tax=Diplodia corticola TaxID=236234 RepID=A0A1J9RZ45_9PEZI|nr:pex19 family protein [Diplodia corticola]OJD33623.1 pex19 family protein [Diplodia corticola]